METPKFTDLSYLREITGGEADIMKEFIGMFFDQIPEFKDGLRTCLQNEQWKELGELAHKAKSSVMTFGLNELGKHLKQLQIKTQDLDAPETFPAYVEEFERIIDVAELELKEELKKLQ